MRAAQFFRNIKCLKQKIEAISWLTSSSDMVEEGRKIPALRILADSMRSVISRF